MPLVLYFAFASERENCMSHLVSILFWTNIMSQKLKKYDLSCMPQRSTGPMFSLSGNHSATSISRSLDDEDHDAEGHHDQADDGNDVPFDDRGSSVAC